MENQSPIGAVNPDIRILARFMGEMKEGETKTYAELGSVIGRDLLKDRHVLQGARKILLRESQIAFGIVRGVGIIRLGDSEVVKHLESGVASVLRKSKRTAQIAVAIKNYENLSNEEKSRHNLSLSTLGVISAFGKPSTKKALGEAVQKQQKRLSLDETLEAFKGKK